LPTGLAPWQYVSKYYASCVSIKSKKTPNIEQSYSEKTIKKSGKYTLSGGMLSTNICNRKMNSSSLADKSHCLGAVSPDS